MKKPFDVDLAKSGAKLVTRNGSPAQFVAHVPEVAVSLDRVIYVVEGELLTCNEDGTFVGGDLPHEADLFIQVD
jgi:hypothetical protein